MLLNCYTIFDLKAQVYHRPFFMRSHGEALRTFIDMATDTNTSIGQHPEDYALYCIGGFDDDRGIISATEAHHSLGKASELLPPPQTELKLVSPDENPVLSQKDTA